MALSKDLKLPQMLEKPADLGSKAPLNDLAKLKLSNSLALDERAVHVICWVAETSDAVAAHPYTAVSFIASPTLEIGDDFRERTSLNALTHFLLFIGIVVTLLGLFYAFSQSNIEGFIVPLAEGGKFNTDSFRQIIIGFTLAFGATAVGYLAYLTARYQTDLVEKDFEKFADLLRSSVLGAFRRTLAPFAAVQPPIDSRLRDQITQLNKTVADSVGTYASDIAVVMTDIKKGVDATLPLVKQLEASVKASTDMNIAFAASVTTLIGSMSTSGSSLADASERMSNMSTSIKNDMSQTVKQLQDSMKTGIVDILSKVSEEVAKFNESVEKFRKEIDVKEIQSELAQGRRTLGEALLLSHDQIEAVTARIETMLTQLNASSGELRRQLQLLNGQRGPYNA